MKAAALAGLSAAGLFALAHRRVLGIEQRPCWPPPADAVTPERARATTEAGEGPLAFAWSTAARIEPWVDGAEFFPLVFADVEAATSSVHILMFGWREGTVGLRMAALLERKLGRGVDVRVVVDGLGSRPRGAARDMYARLEAAGAQIAVNGLLQHAPGRVDHRKLYVIDGAVAWTGGAGIEDHFEDGRFHDVMVRVTGDVVRQAQAAFLSAFRGYGGALPADLSAFFPMPADAGAIPVALAEVLPGGFVAAAQAIREQIDGARERLDLMNPYFTDRDMLDRILAATRRGVRVRLVVAETSNSALAAAASRHHYADLLEAGAEVWELPGVVVHAKIVVADEVVSFGTVNLDAWALYRNSEIALIARSAELAAAFEERLFAPDVARSRPGEPPAARLQRLQSATADKLTYYL